MNGITELAMLLKSRENPDSYSPMFGKVISLPNVKIQIGEKIILDSKALKSCVSLSDTDENGNYINLGKTVAMLPCSDYQKYLVIGVVV